MKYCLLLLFSVTQINAQILVDTFPLPYSNINNSMWGISEYEEILYLGEDFHGDIHRMSKDGNLIDVINVDDDIDFNHGLAYDGIFFYVAEDYTTGGASVFKLDGAGSIQESFVLPPVNGGNSSGVGSLYKEGNTIWYTVYYPDFDEYPYNYAYQYDLETHTLIDTIPLNGAQVYGFSIKGSEVIYVTDDLDGDEERIYVQDRNTDEILYSFPLEDPDGDSSPRGLHWDGSYLWLLANRPGPAAFAYKMVYKYELPAESGSTYETDLDTIDFGLVEVSHDSIRSVLVENTGNESLEISSISISDPGFTLLTALPLTVNPGNSKEISFRFEPSEAISYEATANFSSNSISADKVLVLTGEGLINSGIEEFRELHLAFYPNPVEGNTLWFTTENNVENIQILRLFNIQGKLLYSYPHPNRNYIGISQLHNGTYFIEVEFADQSRSGRRIVIHR